jgi:hypothetical protein
MSEFEDAIGLKESRREEFNTFREALAPYLEQLHRIGLRILIWGPGEGTHFYHKRDEVKQCFRLANENDEVVTSEDLFRNIEHPPQLDIVQTEMLHAHVADVIFGLVTSDPRQAGIYMEVDNLLRFESLINKTWLIVPDKRDWKKVSAFIQQPLLQSFPSYRMKAFRTKVLERCEELRQFCLDKVGEERSRKMRKHIQKVLSGQ